jgi:hypothetical protein
MISPPIDLGRPSRQPVVGNILGEVDEFVGRKRELTTTT